FRAKKYNFEAKPEDYRTALRELAGSFIRPTSEHAVEVLDPSVLDLLNSVVREAPDNALDLIQGAVCFHQIDRVWQFANARACDNVIARLAQEAEALAKALRPLLLTDRRHDLGKGAVAYHGETFERRLTVMVSIANGFRHPSILELVKQASDRLFKEWETEGA